MKPGLAVVGTVEYTAAAVVGNVVGYIAENSVVSLVGW